MARLPSRAGFMLAASIAASAAAAGPASDVFGVGDEKPTTGLVLRDAACTAPADDEALRDAPEMIRNLRGVLGVLTAKDIAALRASTVGARPAELPSDALPLAVLRLRRGTAHEHVELLRDSRGRCFARRPDQARVIPLRAGKLAGLAATWSAYRGDFAVAEVKEFGPPYAPSPYVLDRDVLGDRFLSGNHTRLDGTTRTLSSERFVCRLPRGHDPRLASGLLVWVHAGTEAVIPEPFSKALDELGIVCIAAGNTGNNRPAADRYQLTLDAVATASERVLIDSRRVYATGISGGGKISSMTWACFPDVFAGAVPIVGLSTYENVPNGKGQYWHADYAKPPEAILKLAKAGRLAPITGKKDFNYDSIVAGLAIYTRDKFRTRLFEDPELGHELPSPELFADALRWVDEPARDARQKAIASAKAALERADSAPEQETKRREWETAVREAPWTDEAWQACERLGAAPGRQ